MAKLVNGGAITQEERQLLFQDISARLSYGVKCKVQKRIGTFLVTDLYGGGKGIGGYFIEEKRSFVYPTIEVKPYLRPMSSMTEEEKHYIRYHFCPEYYFDVDLQGNISDNDGSYIYEIELSKMAGYIDFLNSHHFDYRGLIEKGLALAAPKDMYN